ncbi:hypothetical protein KKH36_04250 [Patescibacteria group bacterium]|nr:hypothetical protein [Patescibacteria group bacterium]
MSDIEKEQQAPGSIDLAPGQDPETGLIKPPEGDDTEFVMPEKFAGKSPEDIAKAYAELEKKLGQPAPEGEPEGEPATDAKKAAQEQAEVAEKALKVAGLDMADFTAEFERDGKLSDESYKRLAEGGLPKQVVDTYIQGMKNVTDEAQALSENQVLTIQNEVGGPQVYQVISQWAIGNLTEAEQADYDAAVTSGNADKAKSAVLNLHGRYVATMGQAPKASVRGKGTSPAVQPYANYAQVKTDMANPLYKTDSAFRAKVVTRIANSPDL